MRWQVSSVKNGSADHGYVIDADDSEQAAAIAVRSYWHKRDFVLLQVRESGAGEDVPWKFYRPRLPVTMDWRSIRVDECPEPQGRTDIEAIESALLRGEPTGDVPGTGVSWVDMIRILILGQSSEVPRLPWPPRCLHGTALAELYNQAYQKSACDEGDVATDAHNNACQEVYELGVRDASTRSPQLRDDLDALRLERDRTTHRTVIHSQVTKDWVREQLRLYGPESVLGEAKMTLEDALRMVEECPTEFFPIGPDCDNRDARGVCVGHRVPKTR